MMITWSRFLNLNNGSQYDWKALIISAFCWDEDKSAKLKAERGISLDEISAMILQKQYVDVVKHPKRPGQWMFIMPINAYIHVVTFVLDSSGDVVLKTAFPSRKFHKRFGGSQK